MIKISFCLDQPNFDPYSEEVARDIVCDRRGFGAYVSLLKDTIKVETVCPTCKETSNKFCSDSFHKLNPLI